MRPCQWELRRAVVERGRLPDCRCMARLTSVTEIRRRMIGIRRHREIRRVTSVTVGVDQFEVGVHMTRLTRRRDVRAGEGEFGRAVIEC